MNKETSVAFTGHRESKLLAYYIRQSFFERLFFGSPREQRHKMIAQATYEAVFKFYNEGCRTYYTGMSSGFDLIAAEAVLKLRERDAEVKLIAVVPFKGQDARYSSSEKRLYHTILKQANEAIILAERYIENAQFLRRNDYMIERSSHLICYYDGYHN